MKIAIVGLGLIGASLAKAIKSYTNNRVLGFDKNYEVSKRALKESSIDEILNDDNIRDCDFIVLALYPKASIQFLESKKELINKNTIVFDCGGTKELICKKAFKIAEEKGFTFIGGHPMAGIEKSGYDNSFGELFKGASMILVPPDNIKDENLKSLKYFILSLGFDKITITTAKKHDRVIAYTSQLAHVLSSAYIKSEIEKEHIGFSAGSFNDMTRVAKLNPEMWTELFLENRENLVFQIDTLIEHLKAYRDSIENNDEKTLFSLLEDGSKRKEESLKLEKLNGKGKR